MLRAAWDAVLSSCMPASSWISNPNCRNFLVGHLLLPQEFLQRPVHQNVYLQRRQHGVEHELEADTRVPPKPLLRLRFVQGRRPPPDQLRHALDVLRRHREYCVSRHCVCVCVCVCGGGEERGGGGSPGRSPCSSSRLSSASVERHSQCPPCRRSGGSL